jgi:predicted transcriptional regulator
MPETKTLISDQLKQRVEDLAREQNREPVEVVEEALGRYLASQRLEKLGARLERQALANGIREEDVPGLVEQVRRENEARGQ